MNINDLTDDQLNTLCAKAQGFKRENGCWRKPDGSLEYFYQPTHNGQQAMDLLKKFKLSIEHKDYGWLCDGERADTPELAIVLAVVASVYGDEIDEGLLG